MQLRIASRVRRRKSEMLSYVVAFRDGKGNIGIAQDTQTRNSHTLISARNGSVEKTDIALLVEIESLTRDAQTGWASENSKQFSAQQEQGGEYPCEDRNPIGCRTVKRLLESDFHG